MASPLGFQDYLAQTFQAAQPAGPVMLGAPAPLPPPLDTPPAPAPEPVLPPAGPAPPPHPQAAPQPMPQAPEQGIPPLRGWALQRIGGRSVTLPEHEVEMRGPTLRGAQKEANTATGEAIQRIQDRNTDAAAFEYGVHLDQERSARMREDAMVQAQAERDAEMQQRQADFDQSVKALSKASMDPDRFWSSRSTGQKIASAVSVFFGGFLRGMHGGSNAGLDMINTAIDRDIRAQEFAYGASRDAANAKQTAFGMAMAKYNNADAARAMARAAALDAVQAQLGQVKANYANTDAANRADMAIAQLQQDKTNQIAQGIQFVPSQRVSGGGGWYDPETGIVMTDAQALQHAKDLRGREASREDKGLDTAGKLIVEGAKAHADTSAAGAKDMRAQTVVLPNGDTVRAPSTDEAGQVRAMAANANEVRKLVNKAKEIRSNPGWIASPSAVRELKRIQSNLDTAYGVAKKLGALSKEDREMAQDATGKLTDIGFGVSDVLENFANQADEAWRARVKTYADAPDTAKGTMPASFKAAGGK